MRQKWLLAFLGIALVLGLITLPPAPSAQAGRKGQQIMLYRSGSPYITWMQVTGKDHNGNRSTFTRSYSPATSTAETNGWWWTKTVTIQWRLSNGSLNSCDLDVPLSQPSDWVYANANRGSRLC